MKNAFKEYYSLDLDSNGFPQFTEKNITFVKAILRLDSNYRKDFLKNGGTYTQFLKENGFPKTKDELLSVMKSLNKMNSTRGDVGNSIEVMANYLCDTVDLEKARKRIQEGDLSLVTELANANKNRVNISFSSKFCTYCNQICFAGDAFSKYDQVVAGVLPYYAALYLGEKQWVRRKRSGAKESLIIRRRNDPNWSYELFCDLIGRIIKAINEKENHTITRQDFDWLVWYYFKGDEERQKEALSKIQ